MTTTVDARGLSCPQPVILTLDAIKNGKDKALVVLVDTDTSKENVMRAAASQGYRVEAVAPEANGYRIAIAKD